MAFDRKIKKAARAFETMEGGGVMVSRALPNRQVSLEDVDPFLLLDEARIDPKGPGFPEHPHRGFEIITYLLEGWGSHQDNLGNKGRVEAGGLMKLTAGKGMWHGEQAGGEGAGAGVAHGLQFWVNLPLAQKKREPEFQLLQSSEIKEVSAAGSKTRVLVGPGSAVRIVTPIHYLDVTVDPGAAWEWDLDPAWQGYAFVLEGVGLFGAEESAGSPKLLLLLGSGGGLKVKNSGATPLRFMLAAGQPLRQKILWDGPFVD
jgi:redox-sensitive bicupin YhaK (pirin superfamily)